MKKYALLFIAGVTIPVWGWSQEEFTFNVDDMPGEHLKMSAVPQKESSEAKEQIYKLNWAVDAPITAVGSIWSGYAFTKIYGKDPIPEEKIAALDKNDINGFDRWAAGKRDEKVEDMSDYLFYGSMPLPALLFIDKKIRKDAAKVGFLYWESFAITGMLYTGSTYFTNRYRPETYDNSLSISERTNGNYKNSFFAGHVAVVANATFFMAKVYHDYHPESNFRYVLWGTAAVATGTMVYMRHVAGKHFPSDLIVGTAVGTLSGILVPHFHKLRKGKDQTWSIGPSINPYDASGAGLSFTYRFK